MFIFWFISGKDKEYVLCICYLSLLTRNYWSYRENLSFYGSLWWETQAQAISEQCNRLTWTSQADTCYWHSSEETMFWGSSSTLSEIGELLRFSCQEIKIPVKMRIVWYLKWLRVVVTWWLTLCAILIIDFYSSTWLQLRLFKQVWKLKNFTSNFVLSDFVSQFHLSKFAIFSIETKRTMQCSKCY